MGEMKANVNITVGGYSESTVTVCDTTSHFGICYFGLYPLASNTLCWPLQCAYVSLLVFNEHELRRFQAATKSTTLPFLARCISVDAATSSSALPVVGTSIEVALFLPLLTPVSP